MSRYPTPAGIDEDDGARGRVGVAARRGHRRRKPWNGMRRRCSGLRPEEREVIIARVEMQQSYAQIAAAHGKASPDAARMAVTRALVRLAEEMDVEG